MAYEDWESRWSEGRIGFHQQAASELLRRHADEVWGAGGPGCVLVPLCGKSLDMVFLAERGARVVGVEYVEQAVREFFSERGLEPEVEPGPVARFDAAPYMLFAADFFDVTRVHTGPLDGAFDRAALVALDPPTRERYADHMAMLMPSGARVLLITFEYEQSRMEGPPFAVLADEVDLLFAGAFEVELLGSREIGDARFRERGLERTGEQAYALTRRGA